MVSRAVQLIFKIYFFQIQNVKNKLKADKYIIDIIALI